MKYSQNFVFVLLTVIASLFTVSAQNLTSAEISTETSKQTPQTIASDIFTQDLFNRFVEMRVGRGEPVYWYCLGELYRYPDGKLMARVEGIDTARFAKSESNDTKAVQLSRKTFVYRDPVTNEILREIDGKKVLPIEYQYQYITYEFKDGHMLSSVEQGKQPNVQTIGPGGMNRVRRFGSTIVFSAPLFLNFDTPRGKYEAYENYDFFYQIKSGGQIPYQLTWNRRGSLPPFFGKGDSVFQLVSYRVDRWEFLPKTIREYIEKEAPLWREPPRDLNEIRNLQKASN